MGKYGKKTQILLYFIYTVYNTMQSLPCTLIFHFLCLDFVYIHVHCRYTDSWNFIHILTLLSLVFEFFYSLLFLTTGLSSKFCFSSTVTFPITSVSYSSLTLVFRFILLLFLILLFIHFLLILLLLFLPFLLLFFLSNFISLSTFSFFLYLLIVFLFLLLPLSLSSTFFSFFCFSPSPSTFFFSTLHTSLYIFSTS